MSNEKGANGPLPPGILANFFNNSESRIQATSEGLEKSLQVTDNLDQNQMEQIRKDLQSTLNQSEIEPMEESQTTNSASCLSDKRSYNSISPEIDPENNERFDFRNDKNNPNKKLATSGPQDTGNTSQAIDIQHVNNSQDNQRGNAPQYTTNGINLYTKHCISPYIVYIESQDKNAGKMHYMKLARILKEADVTGIREIKPLGKNRIELTTNTWQQANTVVHSKRLKDMGLNTYIPTFKAKAKGLARTIDPELTEEEILKEIRTSNGSKVEKVQRIKIRDRDDASKLINSGRIVLTFSANTVPDYVYLFHTRVKVEPYIGKLIQCYKCFRFHHLSLQCSLKAPICCNCGNSQHTSEACTIEEEQYKCINCKGNHRATHKDCPYRKQQFEIKKLVVRRNISYKEAAQVIKNETLRETEPPLALRNRFRQLEEIVDDDEIASRPSQVQSVTSYSSRVKGSQTKKTITIPKRMEEIKKNASSEFSKLLKNSFTNLMNEMASSNKPIRSGGIGEGSSSQPSSEEIANVEQFTNSSINFLEVIIKTIIEQFLNQNLSEMLSKLIESPEKSISRDSTV